MQRQYQATEFRTRDTREFKQSQVAGADTRVQAPLIVGDASWRDKMLESLGNQAAGVLSKMADIEFSNLYLEGQAQAGVIESEEELQGNPLTRDWKVAGYRDTMGKLALADIEAQFATDIPKLREKGPEELQAYLATRRGKIMPALGSMSREARAAAAGQLLLQDRAAIKSHTTEHAKFIIEQKSQAVHTQWNTSLRTLGAAQVRHQLGELQDNDYNEQVRSTVGTMVQSVWMDDSLPYGVKQQLTFEMLQSALANDSVDMYDFVASNDIPDGNGGKSSLMARLTGEQQLKVANGYREAQARTRDASNLFQMEQVANLEAQIDNEAYQGSYDDLTRLLDPMVISKSMTGERRQSIINKYLDKQYKGEQSSALADMYMRGDLNGIMNSGKDLTDGLKALDAMLARRKVTPEQRLQTYLNSGLNGMEGGFKRAGEVLGTALRQSRSPDGTVLPQHLATVRTIDQAIRKAEAAGQTGVRVQLLSGMSEGDRMFTERVLAQIDGGAAPDEAVHRATELEAKEADMTPAVKAARTQQTATEVTKAIEGLEPRGMLSSAWTWAKSIFSADASADMTLRPKSFVGDRDGWFGDGPTVQFYTARVREELATEASHVLLQNPHSTPDQVISVARANVAARTISTRFGPLTMPRNVNLEEVFGVGKGNQAAIGPALSAMLKETKEGANWQLAFRNGRLWAQEVDRNGQRVGTGTFLNPRDVQGKIKSMTDAEQELANRVFGPDGRIIKQDGVTVQFNGLNTAGVPATWMFGYRENLIKDAGVLAKVNPYGTAVNSAFGRIMKRVEGDYDVANFKKAGGSLGVKRFDHNNMTVGQVMAAQERGEMFATGRYQIIPETLKGAVSAMGLKGNEKYDQALQDRIFVEYLLNDKRKDIGNYIQGKSNDLRGAVLAVSQEWASFAAPAGAKTRRGFVSDGSMSFYHGNGVDRASVGAAQSATMLQQLRAQQGIQSSFMQASNDAAIAGGKVARDLGRYDQPTFMLMSELAYQSGTTFMSRLDNTGERYREFAAAYKAGNVQQAQEAFKRTAAWYYSADPKNRDKITPRQQNYLRLIEQSLKGN